MVRPGFIITGENITKFKGYLVRIIENQNLDQEYDASDNRSIDQYVYNCDGGWKGGSKIGMIIDIDPVESRLESLYKLAMQEREWSKETVDTYLDKYCNNDLETLYLEIMDIGSDCWPGPGKSDRILIEEKEYLSDEFGLNCRGETLDPKTLIRFKWLDLNVSPEPEDSLFTIPPTMKSVHEKPYPYYVQLYKPFNDKPWKDIFSRDNFMKILVNNRKLHRKRQILAFSRINLDYDILRMIGVMGIHFTSHNLEVVKRCQIERQNKQK